jgi:hypothetical protein
VYTLCNLDCNGEKYTLGDITFWVIIDLDCFFTVEAGTATEKKILCYFFLVICFLCFLKIQFLCITLAVFKINLYSRFTTNSPAFVSQVLGWKSILSDIRMATPACFFRLFAWKIVFQANLIL